MKLAFLLALLCITVVAQINLPSTYSFTINDRTGQWSVLNNGQQWVELTDNTSVVYYPSRTTVYSWNYGTRCQKNSSVTNPNWLQLFAQKNKPTGRLCQVGQVKGVEFGGIYHRSVAYLCVSSDGTVPLSLSIPFGDVNLLTFSNWKSPAHNSYPLPRDCTTTSRQLNLPDTMYYEFTQGSDIGRYNYDGYVETTTSLNTYPLSRKVYFYGNNTLYRLNDPSYGSSCVYTTSPPSGSINTLLRSVVFVQDDPSFISTQYENCTDSSKRIPGTVWHFSQDGNVVAKLCVGENDRTPFWSQYSYKLMVYSRFSAARTDYADAIVPSNQYCSPVSSIKSAVNE